MFRYFRALPLLVILLIPPVFADSNSIQISNSSNDSGHPSIAIDGTNIYIAWADHSRSGPSEIFFSKSIDGGQTFSAPKNISNKQGGSIAPFVATDGTNIYVTWTYRYPDNYSEGWSDDNSEIFFSKSTDGGLTFSLPQKISDDSSFAYGSKLAIDGENIFLTWETKTTWPDKSYEAMGIQFSKSTDGGLTFSPPKNISNNEEFSDSPTIANDGTNIFIAWSSDHMDNTAVFLTKSTDGGETFSHAKNISGNMRYSDAPSIAIDGSDIFIAWMYQVKGENYDVLFSKSVDGGETFTEPQNISNTAGFSTMPTIAIDSSNIFVTWVDGQTTSSPILFSKSTDGGLTFSPPQIISSDTGFSSSQSIASDGVNIFNVWSWVERSPGDKQVLIFSKSSMTPSLTENTEEVPDDTDSALPQPDESISEESIVNNSADVQSAKNIQWLEEDPSDYAVGGIGIIRLDNSELNINKELIEIPVVHVWSDTDPKGITVDMVETGADTGVFYADISFSSIESSLLQLQVSRGDIISVSYEDESLGEPLVATIKIASKYLPPLRQLAFGIPVAEIQCEEGLILAKNAHNGDPMCLKPESFAKLKERNLIQ